MRSSEVGGRSLIGESCSPESVSVDHDPCAPKHLARLVPGPGVGSGIPGMASGGGRGMRLSVPERAMAAARPALVRGAGDSPLRDRHRTEASARGSGRWNRARAEDGR